MDERSYGLEFDRTLNPAPVLPALIWAEGIASPTPTREPPEFLAEVLAQVARKGEEFVPAELRARVRRMLRYGRYRPSGRSKPASEFLLRAAIRGSFPLVNCPVDVNNAISLACGLPGSIFDADLAGTHLLLRRGKKGESYVFNLSGQVIDLEDLLVVCRRTDKGWEPCGNPVKDGMATKITPQTRNVIALLYAPVDTPTAFLEGWAARYEELLKRHCRARSTGFEVVVPNAL